MSTIDRATFIRVTPELDVSVEVTRLRLATMEISDALEVLDWRVRERWLGSAPATQPRLHGRRSRRSS